MKNPAVKFASILLLSLTTLAFGQGGIQVPPIVMEVSTVRGRIVILESFQEDRQAAVGLLVEVWSTKANSSGEGKANRTGGTAEQLGLEKDVLEIETETDEDGFFLIDAAIPVGDYIVVIGNVELILHVIPKDPERLAGDDDEKILLILVPKEIFVS